MRFMRKFLVFLLVVAAFVGYNRWQYRPVVHPPGVLIPFAPEQGDIRGGQLIRHEDYVVSPRAEFDIQARVLSRETYYLGTESDLSPIDLALGWGRMSDQAVLDRIDISQSGRWYFTRYDLPPPIPEWEIINSSSNMHMIPADSSVERDLKRLRPGELVRLKGYLVDIDHESGWAWRTSMRRDDTGKGACEIVYVNDVQRL